MRARTASWCIGLALGGWSAALLAHHSISMVEIYAPDWVKGTVTEYHMSDPHVMLKLEVKGASGKLATWDIEGPNMNRLRRMGAGKDFLKAGDVIEVCGFHLKQPWYKPEFVHGQVLVMPDGHMRLFGPYGKLDNCIRPGDAAEKWVSFLKADALAQPSWCNGKLYVQVASVAPPALVADIDRQLGNPCH